MTQTTSFLHMMTRLAPIMQVRLVNSRNSEEGTDEYRFGDTTTASEGDILDYIVVSKLPTITSEATYLTQYTFVDSLSAGLTYNKDARIAIYNNEQMPNMNNVARAIMAMDLDEVKTSLGNGDTTFDDGGQPSGTWLYSQKLYKLQCHKQYE